MYRNWGTTSKQAEEQIYRGVLLLTAAARAGELWVEEQQLAHEQARWELEVDSRQELQLQALETQARASPGRVEGIAAAQALGDGRG